MHELQWTIPLLETAEEQRLFHFVREELAVDLEDLLPSLEQLAGNAAGEPAAIARRCAEQLRLFTELAATLGTGLGREQRIPLAVLLTECLAALAPLADSRQVQVRMQDDQDGLGPVYGHQRWLKRALHGYLAAQLRGLPQGARLHLELRQSGAFKLLASHWHVPAPMTGPPVPPPLVDALSLALARAVLYAHGGRVRLQAAEPGMAQGAAFGSFAISLPTGAPATSDWKPACPYSDCPVQRQNDRYAVDLARALRQSRTDPQE
jgi:hypothetical protein